MARLAVKLYTLLGSSGDCTILGFNASALRLDNIVFSNLPTRGKALPYLVPQLKVHAGAMLHLLPDTTKTRKEGIAKHLVL